jgi:hypothetical protein
MKNEPKAHTDEAMPSFFNSDERMHPPGHVSEGAVRGRGAPWLLGA